MVDLNALAGLGITTEETARKKNNNDVGQEDFLKLMVAQMQNQDPFSPMENGEFLSQIATFTMASGMNEMQNSFKQFQQDMAGDSALRAASLVGREVLVESEVGHLPEGGSMTGIVKVPDNLNTVKIGIYTSAGELVRELDMGPQQRGDLQFQWDGTDSKGNPLPPGRYMVSAESEVLGEPVGLWTHMSATVNSVTLGKGGQSPLLNIEGIGELSLAAVRQIK